MNKFKIFNFWYLVVALFVILNIFLVFSVNPGPDVIHYGFYGKHLDWSYIDHPPMVGWAMALTMKLFGTSDFALSLPAFFSSLLSIFVIHKIASKLNENKNYARACVLCLFWSVVFVVLMFMTLPQCFLLLFALLSCYFALCLCETIRLRYFIFLGLAMGLAGLSDYTAILVAGGLFVYFLIFRRIVFKEWGLYLAVILAAIIVSPVFIWNYFHNFISFSSVLHHGFSHTWSFRAFYQSALMQVVAYSPGLVVFSVLGIKQAFLAKDKRLLLMLFVALSILLVFAVSGAYGRILFHWPFIGWVIIVPVAVNYIFKNWDSRAVRLGVIAATAYSVLIYFVLYMQIFFNVVHFPIAKAPLRDLHGWPKAGAVARSYWQQLHKKDKNAVLFVSNWSIAGRLSWYSKLPVQVTQPSSNSGYYQFVAWYGKPNVNSNGILVVPYRYGHPASVSRQKLQFAHCQLLKSVPVFVGGRVYNKFSFYHCWKFNT